MARLMYLSGHVEFALSLCDPWFRARTEGCDKMKGTPTLLSRRASMAYPVETINHGYAY